MLLPVGATREATVRQSAHKVLAVTGMRLAVGAAQEYRVQGHRLSLCITRTPVKMGELGKKRQNRCLQEAWNLASCSTFGKQK